VFIGISEYKISIFFRKVFVDNIDIIIHYKVIFTARISAFPSYHPLWNASPKTEGVSPISADFASKIGYHGNVP